MSGVFSDNRDFSSDATDEIPQPKEIVQGLPMAAIRLFLSYFFAMSGANRKHIQ